MSLKAESIRVRGLVQGVGFRPAVWRLARKYGLAGRVLNDGDGVHIWLQGPPAALEGFVSSLREQCPPLARIDELVREATALNNHCVDFRIVASQLTEAHTGVVPDAASCAECVSEIFTHDNRREGYAFTNCTHCGPRLSILKHLPYDRAHTSMATFILCPDCQREYDDPADRRFHAQPNACPVCGPRVWLEAASGDRLTDINVIAAAARLIREGRIVAIKGIGGIHLACDAGNTQAVQTLRQRKHRYHKPLALMARDIEMVSLWAEISAAERDSLQSSSAPVVVLTRRADAKHIAEQVAPGQQNLGFMLPYTPLHHLLMAQLDRPIVLTSGNRSDEPQCTANDDARQRLGDIADALLLHDRDIVNRIDDSVVRWMDGKMVVLRRARGLAPAPLRLPAGFESVPDLLAMGGELKNTFCLLQDGQAILSQHMGDLEEARTFDDYLHNLELYRQLYQHQTAAIVIDKHPEYLSSKRGREWAGQFQLPLIEVQHHHAHVAACLAENGHPLERGKVLGIALDGLGYGDDALWGGEFLRADYLEYERIGQLRAYPMPGNAQAMREPWRNTYAHLTTCFEWKALQTEFGQLPIIALLLQKPLATLDAMMAQGRNAPLASSAGRLFDAVAGALGICTERTTYEGQAAIELEACMSDVTVKTGYGFGLKDHVIDPCPMWWSLLRDLRDGVEPARMAARFHIGLADAVCTNARSLCRKHQLDTVVLSGGVWQNKTLLNRCRQGLETAGLRVLTHSRVPANDGGLALGQAVIAAATLNRRD